MERSSASVVGVRREGVVRRVVKDEGRGGEKGEEGGREGGVEMVELNEVGEGGVEWSGRVRVRVRDERGRIDLSLLNVDKLISLLRCVGVCSLLYSIG